MTQTVKKSAEIEKEITYIDIETIMPNRGQPRTFFDAEGLNELAESIKKYGILQPLTVRKVVESSKYSHFQYELIAGERRLRAAKLIGMEKVPCILMESDSKTSAALAIIENLHRRDLNVFEEASAIASLIEIYHLTQEQVASKLSMTQAGVANKLRLLKLSNEEKELILSHNLTERHARALLRIKTPLERLKLLKKIIENNLNVKQAEDYIERSTFNPTEGEKITKKRKLTERELISSIEKAITYTRNNGITVKTQQTETDTEIIFTVAIQK
jgi:ParB family chromosome partitioning protein